MRGEPARLSQSDRLELYAARRFLGSEVTKSLGLRIPFDVYFQDPLVAEREPGLAFDGECFVPWEPGLADGPTSARFAVVDYDAHTQTVAPPAIWDRKTDTFRDPTGKVLDRDNAGSTQFHQVNVWAILQRALDFFESGFGLGRRIAWGFPGNRLIVVPHAGPGENAFYDRRSKSLQFYYFEREGRRIETCLSTDIVHHEFGHAVLDGIRPLYIEAVSPETAAFHEFMGDLTALLITFRNTAFRKKLVEETEGDLARESTLTRLADEFGRYVANRPYLRSARNTRTMADVADDQRPHFMSEVLTGAMFDIVVALSRHYIRKGRTAPAAFWDAIQRMQIMAIQPLDFLPPVDATFRDYALAVLRSEEIANPTDPDGYRSMMIDAFVERGILDAADRVTLTASRQIFERLDLDVFHDIDAIAGSRPDAYRFLDDNRRKLFIPQNADIEIVDLCIAQKFTRQARRLPRQILLQYVWREDIVLESASFGPYAGKPASLLCGATLAFNQNGEVLAWARKPGSEPTGDSSKAQAERAEGARRREAFLRALEQRVKTGRIGAEIGGEQGLVAKTIRPLVPRIVDGSFRFELSPHLGIHDDEDDIAGGRQWQISS